MAIVSCDNVVTYNSHHAISLLASILMSYTLYFMHLKCMREKHDFFINERFGFLHLKGPITNAIKTREKLMFLISSNNQDFIF